MKRKNIVKFLGMTLGVLSIGAAVMAQTKSTEPTYPVRILFEPRPDAKFYQIEWLEDDKLKGQATASKDKSQQEKITKTEIRRDLPMRFKYFRMRSAYRDDLYGAWGEIVEIQRVDKTANNKPNNNKPAAKTEQDVFVQVIDREGKAKWVLRGTSVPVERLSEIKPIFYDVECLTEKNAPENTNGRKLYQGPIPFTRAGQYKMNLYASENASDAKPLQTWIFWVYTETPHSYVKFYAPFLHGKGGFTVGGKTKIALLTHHSQTAIDKVEYSIRPAGSASGPMQKYDDEIEVNSFAKDRYGRYEIEYQTTSVTGAQELKQTRTILIDAKGPVIEEVEREGKKVLTFRDENFPIVVRIYKNGVLVSDQYFKQWKSIDALEIPEAGSEIRAIDLLGNETVLKK